LTRQVGTNYRKAQKNGETADSAEKPKSDKSIQQNFPSTGLTGFRTYPEVNGDFPISQADRKPCVKVFHPSIQQHRAINLSVSHLAFSPLSIFSRIKQSFANHFPSLAKSPKCRQN
jgi:hypothetical protein